MADALSTVFWGVVTFSILVILHEGGHYLAARLFGVKVHEFMIGLPGPALRYRSKRSGIAYGVTAVPLGGYVKIAGMEPGPEDPLLAPVLALTVKAGRTNPIRIADELGIDAATAEDLLVSLQDWGAVTKVPGQDYEYDSAMSTSLANDPDALLASARDETYRGLPTWKRVTILSAGVAVNLLTAIIVFTVVLSIFGNYNISLKVSAFSPKSPAQAAGLHKGDVIQSVNGSALKSWDQLVQTVSSLPAGKAVRVTVIRNGQPVMFTVVLGHNTQTGGGLLGVQGTLEKVHYTVIQALGQSFVYVGLVFQAIGNFFRPSTFRQSIGGARSIIGVSAEVNQAAKAGALDYAWIVALLSLSLGALNILPIPPLDGGKVAMELVEGVSGHPLPRALVVGVSAAGALLLFTLIGYLMYADTVRLIHGG